ncbi:MAG: hypothetical protein WA823_16360 [Candidatus Acidiferrales bacterium]
MSIGHKSVTGVFETYAQAESAVEDLEELGISGGDVVLIPGAATDLRGRSYIERSSKPLHQGERFAEKVADALHLRKEDSKVESSWVGVDGQPKMSVNDPLDIEDAELTDRDPALAGPAVVIVRLLNEKLEDEAAQALTDNGAVEIFREVESRDGVTPDHPEATPARAIAGPNTELGTGKATTGADHTDLQGRGQKFKTRGGSKD